MSLFEELTEVTSTDKKIVKSFKTKDSLSSVIFDTSDGEFFMRKEIKDRLLEISDNFIEFLGIDFFIHDIILTGSLANYNWSDYSDVDLHILIDFKETDYKLDILKEFFDSKKNLWNKNHNIKIKKYDVELYVQDVDEKHLSSGVYSVLHDKWLVEPEKSNPKIDDRKIIEKGDEYSTQIDDLISKSKGGEDVSEEIDELKDKIKRFRQCGLDDGGEYSYENLTFKLLRRNGYIEKLINLKSEVADKKLSITQ
jgi:predicted nucleotidyltransferase